MGRPEYDCDLEWRSERPPAHRSWKFIFIWSVVGYICILAAFFGLFSSIPSSFDLGILPFLVHQYRATPFRAFSKGSGYFNKPQGLKIVGVVPFHSYERTEILDCYLQKNLVNNRGFLDEVIFVPRTNDATSLNSLDLLVKQTPLYTIAPENGLGHHKGWNRDDLYLWIDGDVVFLEDHTIPTIVKTKLDYPDSSIVSANVINEAALTALHSHPGTALPYLPELLNQSAPASAQTFTDDDWRVSNLPHWEGPADFKVDHAFIPPSESHRWLPASEKDAERTPIVMSVYGNNGPGMDHWTVHAQQHYSFLSHLELGNLHRYKFPMWSNPVESISSHLLCLRGKDLNTLQFVLDQSHSSDLDMRAVRATYGDNRRIIIDGKGLAVHYSTNASSRDLDNTDILRRYRGYAEETVCPQIV